MRHICGKLFNNAGQIILMIFLYLRPEVKAAVTQQQYATLCNPKMYTHTILRIPTSKNIGDMLWRRWYHTYLATKSLIMKYRSRLLDHSAALGTV